MIQLYTSMSTMNYRDHLCELPC